MRKSPFKFLDAYDKADRDIFFGREIEVETLYQMTFQTNLILVYGMSGTGKTSIIRCGLANRFDSSDWYDIYIRRQENINKSLLRELRLHDKEESFEPEYGVDKMVHSLYMDHLRPIYLIFDQFEELFILGKEDEQHEFIQTIKLLLQGELPCKILIVMREEYLAHLSEFEKVVPRLFDKRLRIEPMTRTNARNVILNTARNKKFNIELCYEEIAEDIIEMVTEGKGRVQLTYLQVFLDKMYRLAAEANEESITFDIELVKEVGQINDVLAAFLEEQLNVFVKEVDRRDEAMRWLKAFVSEKGTKIPVKRAELPDLFPNMSEPKLQIFLEFFVNRRILRPLDNDQYELSHDSLASKIYQYRIKGIAMPTHLPKGELSGNPFVGFEPYHEEMAPVFFGREIEVKELFDKVVNEMDVRTTLVIGPMGVGKTSLVKAGLIPYLSPLFKVKYLRCSREFIDTSLVQKMLNFEPLPEEDPIWLEIAFQWDKTKPNQSERKVIVMDQFEEFFIWIKDQSELIHLYLHLAYLLESRHNVDIVIVVRDEFFSQLQDLEAFVPKLLEEQLRVRHVPPEMAAHIIEKTAAHADFVIEDPEVIKKIVQNVSEEDGKVNLTYLQLYMDRLYQSVQEV
ncbi:MAG: hypothetical protein DHS20C18_08960 [Saprospiraceae bacterium]|nr:MAG: hypothetical protein DHS20C18_08960 [Saprospiraceae bacterium]